MKLHIFEGWVPQWKNPLYFQLLTFWEDVSQKAVLLQPVKSGHPIYFYSCVSEMYVGIE